MTSPFSCGYLLMLILKNNLEKKSANPIAIYLCSTSICPDYFIFKNNELHTFTMLGQNFIYVQLCLLNPGIGMVAGFYQTAFLKYTISKTLFRNNFSVTALRWRYVIFRKFKICVLIFIAVMMVSFSPSLTYLKGNTNIDFMLMATCV